MRRTASPLSLVILGLGVFLLVLAPMLAWYVTPRAKVNPIDIDSTTVLTGKGAYFDTGEVETLENVNLTVTRQVRGDVADSTDDVAAWDVATSIDPDKSLPASSPHDSLQWTQERWVTDRRTNKAVHCCGEEPYFEGEAYLKFPFDVQERSYTWWDSTLGATVPLTYRGKKTVGVDEDGDGKDDLTHEGLRFTAEVEPTRTGTRQVPGTLVGVDADQVLAEEWYENHGVELVVDQRTGRILYAQIGPRKTLRAPGADNDAVVLLDSEKLAFTDATLKDQIELVKPDVDRLKLVSATLPIGSGALGLVLVVVGGVLVVRGRERPAGATPEGPNAGTEPEAPAPVTAPV
ncbi:DUF3068 domain-containing protein [Streptomyces sp. NPDC050418]|uniref:DUF3068 domain-containing protein n=1 Tax=Streptomyces sp. NPDC050418 TaxID=3365612 RepID=UPI003796299B